MSATVIKSDWPTAPALQARRFDRVAITCVFGDPRNGRSWSGAPNNLANALERLGIAVESIHKTLPTGRKLALAVRHLLGGFGRLTSTEQLLRGAPARRRHALHVADRVRRLGVRHVIHTGTLDLPALDLLRGVKHYLYCDHTWALSLRHRPDRTCHSAKARDEFEKLERESFCGLKHIFTFGRYVRDHMIEHYGVSPERVTAVGSGWGGIAPYFGPKDFTRPSLLFVAKHFFKEKGGELLLDAFRIAQGRRPDLALTVVGDERSRRFLPADARITFRAHVAWEELQRLFRDATLLAEPMLNDPWGQVYLEALVSRTPVLGLARNGLPEIIEGNRHGFLVDRAEPEPLASAILDAIADPGRLAAMGLSGQRHVLNTYSWDRVAERIAFL